MTDKEICRSYRNAINRMTQIRILSELTGYSRIKIITILRMNGEKLPEKCMAQLEKRMDTIEAKIKELETEYKEIAQAIMAGGRRI